jgi:GxxExxY protein
MHENAVSSIVVDAAIYVHRRLGPGLLESAYQLALAHTLRRRHLEVREQVAIALRFDDLHVPDAFRADLVVEELVIVELKAVREVADVHRAQLLTYLRCSGLRLGLLLNFGSPKMKDGLIRVVNGLTDGPGGRLDVRDRFGPC